MIAAGLLDRLQRLRAAQGARERPALGRRTPRPAPAGARAQRPSRRQRGRQQTRRALRLVPRLRARTVLILVAVVLVLAGGWLWLRESSLVAVNRVTITGVSGPDAALIRSALRGAAENMTTLDVRMDQLRSAVAPYPVVKDLRVSTQFPHGIRIHVIEQAAVGAVTVGGRTIPVAGDGTLLHDVAATASLPTIPLRVPPGGTRLTDPDALAAVEVLAAAPSQMLGRVTEVTSVAEHGLVAQLRNGPSIYFGDTERLAAKWLAAAAVLGDPGSAGALYIDVTDPERPAAGASSSSSAGATSATSDSSTGAAAATSGG
jgi:cell division protein FtsQ